MGNRFESMFTCLLAAGVVASCLLLAWVTWCSVTTLEYVSSGDFARYVSMLWNTAHGRPFYTSGGSYLYQHLSFSLMLLSPIYWFADHPLTFVCLPFAVMLGGAAVLARVARRANVPWMFVWALLLYWCGFHFMREIHLGAFHTVTAYLLLIPLLYWAVLLRSHIAIVAVLTLILGLREEAGLMVIPLFLYFAVREHWRAGYLYAGLAFAYVALATLVLFPWINDISIFARRAKELQGVEVPEHLWRSRGISLLWILLPVLPLLRRGWKPIVAITSVAVLTSLMSSFERQCQMRMHYPAVVMATLAVAMIETLRARSDARTENGMLIQVASVWMFIVTVVSCFADGKLFGTPSRLSGAELARLKPDPHFDGIWAALKVIPKDASVGVQTKLAGFVANRAELLWEDSIRNKVLWNQDYIFFDSQGTPPQLVRDEVAAGRYEIIHDVDGYMVLKRTQAAVQPKN